MVDVEVGPGLTIPDEELVFRFSRSSGPGGQHANTSDTRVELCFDIEGSQALTDEQRRKIRARLGNRVTAGGMLVLSGDEHRSQTRNRDVVLARFAALLADALRPERPRKPTRRPRAAEERRLQAKRQRSEKKARRRPPEAENPE